MQMTIDMARYQALLHEDESFRDWVRENRESLSRVMQVWPMDHTLTMWRAVALYDMQGYPYGHNPEFPQPTSTIISTTPGKHRWLVARRD